MTPELLFGTAGIPLSAPKRDSVSAQAHVRKLGLDAMELEFVRGVNMKEELAHEVRKAAEENEIALSVHAPYYINLNAKETQKRGASRTRILDSARVGDVAGARTVTFHPAYFQGQDPEKVFATVKEQIEKIQAAMKEKKLQIALAPETTGKPTQFGSLTETLRMAMEIKGVLPMVDFSHLHARDAGRFKQKEDIRAAVHEIRDAGAHFLDRLQMHASGIVYSEKGERHHAPLESKENTFPYKWFLEVLKEEKVGGVIICESPNIEKDALLMKAYYEKL